MKNTLIIRVSICLLSLALLNACQNFSGRSANIANTLEPINRKQVVERHNPVILEVNPQAPFTLGNGKFSFTADVTGLQSLPDFYFQHGIPLETKARWAWHSRVNPEQYNLADAYESYAAYGREVDFPTDMESPAGQWLRQNPHDLPLARIGFLIDGAPLEKEQLSNIKQTLNLWEGRLLSNYQLGNQPVSVETLVDNQRDKIAAKISSPLLVSARLGIAIKFPRGYDLKLKNTPDILWNEDSEHTTDLLINEKNNATFVRVVDDSENYVEVNWQGNAKLVKHADHEYHLIPRSSGQELIFSVTFSQTPFTKNIKDDFSVLAERVKKSWAGFWRSGAAVDFSGSTNLHAHELERRIILSRYLLAVQARAQIPAQETGLTSSSWYGKHHTEMTWWHTAHWALWGQPKELAKVLDWYTSHLPSAKELAQQRGLQGARWAKMVGPDNRESPGGNPLIIWNQPQFIHLAELLYQGKNDQAVVTRYAELVEQTAEAMASMLVWEEEQQRYSLDAPIWIAQEIYDPRATRNPTFELAYWREGLRIAQLWRQRLGLEPNPAWQKKITQLAALPQKDNKYVAIESIPDTFDNIESRQDHPSMLAAFGLLNDPSVDPQIMRNTLNAVLASWDWEAKIWGWDYPMIAMTASRLQQPQIAVDILLADKIHNRYLPNGHCPQQGAELPVYLPANGALLSAVAMMIGGWENAPDRPTPGFPDDGTWKIKAEGFIPFP